MSGVSERLEVVPLDRLRFSSSRLFREHSQEELRSLARSIRRVGVLHSPVVRPLPDGTYEVISGHGRVKAARMAGLEEIAVKVVELDDASAEVALIDANVEVRPPSPMELARAIRRRKELLIRVRQAGKPGKEILGQNDPGTKFQTRELLARELGISPRQVSRYDALNDLIPELQEMVEKGTLGVTVGSYLGQLPREVQQELFDALGEAVAELKEEEIRKLREEQERGYTILEVLARRVEELEAELASLEEAHGAREQVLRELEQLKKRKRELTYDILDREQALKVHADRYRKPKAALLHIVETLGSAVQAQLPEIKVLLEEGPLDGATATHLLKWVQVFRYAAEVLEPPVKAALSENGKEAVRDGNPG